MFVEEEIWWKVHAWEGAKMLAQSTIYVVPPPNGAAQPKNQTQEPACTPKIKDYNSHQTNNIYQLHCGRWAH